MRLTLAFLLFISAVLHSSGPDSLQLRIFPGMEKYKISSIEAVSRDFVLAAGSETLLLWDGENWTEFIPQIPLEIPYLAKIRAFSPRNIWVLYRKQPFIYHTEILHFNGSEWRSIPTPQPYDILTVSFLDSNRFFAGGAWSSLFYFDGLSSTNIRTPPNIPKHQINKIAALTEDEAIIVMQNNEYEKKDFLYRLSNGRWQPIDDQNNNITAMHFNSPDSGIIITHSGVIYQFTGGSFIAIDTLLVHDSIYPFLDFCGDTIYYGSARNIYRYHNSEIEPIFHLDFEAWIYHIGGSEFFLIDRYRRIYYLGHSNHGMEIGEENPKFYPHYPLNQGPGGHTGVSLYPTTWNTINLCFVNPVKPNWVYSQTEDLPFQYYDTATRSGLVGEHEKILWDGGLYFADIDNDGDLDAILAALNGNSLLYENIGEDHFQDVTEAYDFRLVGRIALIYWCDLNLDGNLDFIAGDETGSIRFFVGNGFFGFTDVTHEMGISDSLISYMPAPADTDGDGDLDLLLYSQYDRVRYLENQGIMPDTQLPMFVDKSDLSPELTTRFDFFTQSVAFGDYDNDGDLDLFLANRVSPLKLFESDGNGIFRDVSQEKGFGQQFLSYGGNWGDLNQDGYPDLFVTTLGKNYIFWNKGGEFFEIDSLSLPNNELAYSTGSVLADLDRDGDLDVIVANNEIGVSCIYENLLNRDNRLEVHVNNSVTNRYGVGSTVYVYESGHLESSEHLHGLRQIHTNQGYSSSGLPVAHFGLPMDKKYDILVRSPSGEEVKLQNVAIPNVISISKQVSLASYSERIWIAGRSLFLHPGRRPLSIQIIAFLIILIGFNIYLFRFSTWQREQKLFFNFLGISGLVLLSIFSSTAYQKIIPLVIYGGLAGFSFYLVDSYLKLKRSETNPYQLYRLLQKFNHGEVGIRQLDRLRYLANNFQHEQYWEESVKAEVGNFRNYTVRLLKDVSSATMEMNLPNSMIRQTVKLSNHVISRCEVFMSSKGKFREKSLRQYAGALNSLIMELSRLRSEVDKMVSCYLLETIADGLNKFPRFTEVSVTKPEFMNDLRVIIPRVDLMQVLSNLFQNSLDALRRQKTKKLSISVAEGVNNTVTIRIEDNGPGVSSEIKNQIFDESFSSKQQSGVGLFHARELLRQYGGDIHLADRSLQNGACFEIKLMVLNHENNGK